MSELKNQSIKFNDMDVQICEIPSNEIPKEFLRSFLINLKKDTHKYKRFFLSNFINDVKFNIWRGIVLMNNEHLKEYQKFHSFAYGTKVANKKGNIGSAFAHMSLWKYCLCLPDEYFLIMEDNCQLKANFKLNVINIVKHINDPNLDFLNLNVLRPKGRIIGKIQTSQTEQTLVYKMDNLRDVREPMPNVWISGYIIAKKFIPKLIEALSEIDFNDRIIDREIIRAVSKMKHVNYYHCHTNSITNHCESNTDFRKIHNSGVKIENLEKTFTMHPTIPIQLLNKNDKNIIYVLSITHKHGPKEKGKYFHFDRNSLHLKEKNILTVQNLRTMVKKEVVIWNVINGGDKGDAHGRYINNNTNNDFRDNDILYIIN
jgi:GR25 family glycosyltransferase involved in LPS biosynthesis